MKGIGGNIQGTFQVCTIIKNDIGETVETWADKQTITGWLDFQSGSSKYESFNADIQESTHVFVADYTALDSSITSENSRMLINGKAYEVLLIDNPMEMQSGSQLEIYLKFTGGQ